MCNCCNESELSKDIAWAGKCEEFHQKRQEYFMFDYWKNHRLKLEQQNREERTKLTSTTV